MCRHTLVMLSAEDKAEVKKLSGKLIPLYASNLLAMVVAAAVAGGSRQGELVASSSAPAATR
jgi:hypothetical protein